MNMRNEVEGFLVGRFGRIWYAVHGSGTPGIPLLVLHGGPGAPHDYLEPLSALSDERPVIFYDQLGCGNSDRPSDPAGQTLRYFVEELAQVRAGLGLGQVHLLGQSWGCMLAADYLLSHRPEGVIGVVFSGPCLSAPRFVADLRRYLADLPDDLRAAIERCEATGEYDSPEYEDAVNAFYRKHVCRLDPWPDCMLRTLDKMGLEAYHRMWGPSEFTLTGTLKDFDCTDRLREITVPALFTCGRFDEATPETTAFYQSRLPGSEMVIFEDASHEHHLEKPEEFLATVRGFLGRIE
jgi:proline iminopeptidase